jgi:hypothetical protein
MDLDDDRPEEPIALAAYDALAESYAALVDTKPHNAYYERPAIPPPISLSTTTPATILRSSWSITNGTASAPPCACPFTGAHWAR